MSSLLMTNYVPASISPSQGRNPPSPIRLNYNYTPSQLSPPQVCISMPKPHQRLPCYAPATMPGIFATDAAAPYVQIGVNSSPVPIEWPRK